ncbi:MAG: hypothetical protein HXY40_18030 [Chloroflexi bacterium]|nr:hypothetical protein [Chloroflexota bacterium]
MRASTIAIISLLLLLGAAFLTMVLSVQADCVPGDYGTPGDDVINCTTSGAPDATEVFGETGNDSITIDTGVTVSNSVYGDAPGATPSGNDTIVNNGSVNGGLYGDASFADGSGNDTIVNNGQTSALIGDSFSGDGSGNDTLVNNGQTSNMYGDTVSGGSGSGSDTITNNGAVNFGIYGDSISGDSSGNDTITNNGSVTTIVGDSISGDSSGNDTITNNGTTTNIYGDNLSGGSSSGSDTITNNGVVVGDIDAGGGDDTVIIRGLSVVGDGINGGDGFDTLTFDLSSTNPAELQAIAQQIAAANPAGGTITIFGSTYNWLNFEQLTQILTVLQGNGYGAPLAVFCAVGGGIDVYIVVGNRGLLSLRLTPGQIRGGLEQAFATTSNVRIGLSTSAAFYVLSSGELQANTADNSYAFRFFYEPLCGPLPDVPAEPVITPEPVEELPANTIVNRPFSG